MVNFRDLKLKDEKVEGVDYEKVPEQRAGFPPNLPMGEYGFALPASLDDAFEVFDATKDGKTVQRLSIQFDAEILKGPAGGVYPRARISNVPRNRSRRGEPEALVSDMDYLLISQGITSRPPSNQGYIDAVRKIGGGRFSASNEWSARCSDQKVRRIFDDTGASVEDPEGKMGCGNAIYSRDIPRNPENPREYLESFTCARCNSALRAFQQLGRIRRFEG